MTLQQHLDLLHGRRYSARQSRTLDPHPSDVCPHLARLRATQHHGCVPAARHSLHEAIQRQSLSRLVGREIQRHPDDIANGSHSTAGFTSLPMRWTQDNATMHHNTAAWSDIVLITRRAG